ncbi:MAG: SprB repeat-containing protein [Sphingobacteriales bacterium]|nr:SprB repeat-containing protein [Sphingobacteriales bacterium]
MLNPVPPISTCCFQISTEYSAGAVECTVDDVTASVTDVKCNGDTDGEITWTTTGGASPYNYALGQPKLLVVFLPD